LQKNPGLFKGGLVAGGRGAAEEGLDVTGREVEGLYPVDVWNKVPVEVVEFGNLEKKK
jgi:hypothetical protein